VITTDPSFGGEPTILFRLAFTARMLSGRIIVTAGDRLQRYGFFDVGDADQALARFEELCSHLA
jgi:hypothetical protein